MQYRGHQGEADYQIVDTNDGETFTVLRMKTGRVPAWWLLPTYAAAVASVTWERAMDRERYNDR